MTESSTDYTVDEMMTVLMAREVRNDDVMIVGVGGYIGGRTAEKIFRK